MFPTRQNDGSVEDHFMKRRKVIVDAYFKALSNQKRI
jgi:hypothetical protein